MAYPTAEEIEKLREMVTELATQDNRATHLPIYVVRSYEPIYHHDPDGNYGDSVWFHMDDMTREMDPEEIARLDALYYADEDTDMYGKFAIQENWKDIQFFLTNKAAEAYIEANRHNMVRPHVYVASGYRNKELEFVRNILPKLLEATCALNAYVNPDMCGITAEDIAEGEEDVRKGRWIPLSELRVELKGKITLEGDDGS